MKKIYKYSLLVSLILILANCSPDIDGTYGEPVNRDEQITGTWVMQKATQIDLDAEKKSFPDFATVEDITNAIAGMPFSDFSMQIESGKITTVLGNSPMSFVISEGTGTWNWVTNSDVDLVYKELGINASSAIETQINGESVTLAIRTYTGITGTSPKLSLNYVRSDADSNSVTRYEYTLVKQ